MKDAILRQKFSNLATFPILKADVLEKAERIIRASDDWKLTRVNPLAFATENNIDIEDSLNFFIHATKVGLFDFAYNLICPRCGGIVHTHHKLDQIQNREFDCVTCNVLIATLLDDHVEVAFELHPSLVEKPLDPLESFENYREFYFSKNLQKSDDLLNWIDKTNRAFFILKPDEHKEFDIELTIGQEMGDIIQILSIAQNSASFFKADEAANVSDQHQILDLLESGFQPKTRSLKPGNYKFSIHNRTRWTTGFQILTPNINILMDIVAKHPSKSVPFLTAKMLLNNQSFRDIFRIHNLSPDLNLNVKSLTILFTDLRGSTEMYDKAGDIFAFRLVQEHFQLLTETVREFKGAIVKTMGDAIMATFSSPTEGLLASIKMLRKIDEMNENWKNEGHTIGLKVGLNEGSALAVVNDERLDYFGQSVNIAARIQGLATSGEIWISESIWNAPGMQEEIIKSGFQYEKQSARLKGVGTPATVFRLFAPTAYLDQPKL